MNGDLYKSVIKSIISEGGDTDTNACIAGGLIGALIGFSKLPNEYKLTLLKVELGKNERRRNEKMYEPKNGFRDIIKLIRLFK